MKALRLAKIVELTEKYEIYTQEDLLKFLEKEGFSTTQATISRDIRELHLVKSITEDGKYKYTTACASLDTMRFEGIVGTLAGDDTIFILMRTELFAEEITSEIKKMLSSF
ncbi:MAG: arginine repressor [Oscillospiraceae bacterium]